MNCVFMILVNGLTTGLNQCAGYIFTFHSINQLSQVQLTVIQLQTRFNNGCQFENSNLLWSLSTL